MNYFERIYELAIEGNPEAIKAFIQEHHISIDIYKPMDGSSAAERLVFEGKIDAANLLLQLGASATFVARGAARAGNFELVEHLIKTRKMNISAAAQGAARGGYREAAQQFLQRGAHIDALAVGAIQNGDFDFADEMRLAKASINVMVFMAASCGHWEYVNSLRQQGASVDYVAFGAARGGHSEKVSELRAEGASLLAVAQGAVLGGFIEDAKSYLQAGINPEVLVRSAESTGYLFFAMDCRSRLDYFKKIYTLAKEGKETELEALLKDPFISVDVRKLGTNITAAELLASEKNRSAVNLLRKYNASIHCIARGAARANDVEFCEELRHSQANINAIAQGAAEYGNMKYVETLLKNGAGIMPVAHGVGARGDKEYALSLLKAGASAKVVARGAVEGKHLDNALDLVRQDLVNIGYVILYAAAYGYHDFVETMQTRGANIDNVAQGYARGGYRDAVEKLLSLGANLDLVAAAVAKSGHLHFAEILRKRGANINMIGKGAAEGGHLVYVEYLLSLGVDVNEIAPSVATQAPGFAHKLLQERGADLNKVAYGAAVGGLRAFAEELRSSGANKQSIAKGAISGGYREYAEFLRCEEPRLDMDDLACYAASCDRQEYAEFLRKKGANINWMAMYAAKNGNRMYAEHLRSQGADVKYIIRGAKDGDYTAYVNFLLQLPMPQSSTAPAAPQITADAAGSDNSTHAPQATWPILYIDTFLREENITSSSSNPPSPIRNDKESEETSLKRSQQKAELDDAATTAGERVEKRRRTERLKRPDEKNALFSGKYSRQYERLPQAPFLSGHSEAKIYSNTFLFESLDSSRHAKATERTIHTLAIGKSTFRLASYRNELPCADETVTFVFAGRRAEAMLPNPALLGEQQRLLVVVGYEEYRELSDNDYAEHIEFLVIDSLQSETHGSYHPEDIQSRRLAAFVVSFAWGLKHCVYLDDNLKLVQAQTEFSALSTWADMTESLKGFREEGHAVLCGMQTSSRRPHPHPPQYSYKLSDVDFQQVVRILNLKSADDVFVLGYPAKYSGYCMEDFYFQMIIDFALYARIQAEGESDGLAKMLMRLPAIDSVSLIRAKRIQNSARVYMRGLIEDILEIDVDDFSPAGVIQEHAEFMRDSLLHLKKEIRRSFNLVSKQRRQLENGDFRAILESNNNNDATDTPMWLAGKEPELIERSTKQVQKAKKAAAPCNSGYLRTNWAGLNLNQLVSAATLEAYLQEKEIKDYLYPYQADALRAISQSNDSNGIVKINTGGGKTLLGIVLANYLIKYNPKRVVHVVVPTIQLANQYRQEFKRVLRRLGESSAIENKNVISVHSKDKGISKDLLSINKNLRKKASVYIFCAASYSKILGSEDGELAKHRAPLMVMLDECHLYWKKVLELRDSGMTTLGFSATPGKAVLPLFTFSREDSRRAGTTVSLIIDRLSISMNNDRNLKKHEQIAKLTGQHLHPLGKPLASYKGIIYTSSIEEANELADAINQRQSSQGNGPKLARAIHSQVKDYETWIDDFKRKSMDTAAILVVVDMLGTGYDDVDVAWGIYAKNRGSRIENHSQMVGRSLRKNPRFPNKIAYFLTDDELLLDTDEIYKDEEALARAHDDYYEYNHQVIYIELLNAIDKQRPFKHYSPMFAHHKLDFKYSLSKNLMLLLKALASDQEEWSRGLLDLNQDLRRYWKDSRGREFNLAEVFLNEVIGLKEGNKDLLKQSLFTPESFEKLVAILDKQYPDLLSQLTAKISLRELLSKVDLDYTKILRKYNSLPSRVVAGSLIISEGESVIRIRVNSSSSSSSGLNPHAFLNSQGRHVVNDIKQGEQLSPQKEKDSGFPRPMGMD